MVGRKHDLWFLDARLYFQPNDLPLDDDYPRLIKCPENRLIIMGVARGLIAGEN